MFCEGCKTEKEEKDFYGKVYCYKCSYEVKRKSHDKKCKTCSKSLPLGRWSFCSEECFNNSYLRKQERGPWKYHPWKQSFNDTCEKRKKDFENTFEEEMESYDEFYCFDICDFLPKRFKGAFA